MIVTAVERRRRRKQVDVFVDGRFALTLSAELAVASDVRPGRELSAGELSALGEEEARRGAMEAALRLLSYRARSEQELRERLARKSFPQPVIQRTLIRVRELGYLDDAAFARFWTETRQASRPRARRVVVGELRRRGIDREAIEAATAEISDEDEAYRAASRRLRLLGGLEYQVFRERLGGFLTRRGFGYDVARRTIDRCWAELGEAATGSEAD